MRPLHEKFGVSERIYALAAALHSEDDTCNANYYLAFEECGNQAWDIQQAEAVERALAKLGWMLARDPAGSSPMFPTPSLQGDSR